MLPDNDDCSAWTEGAYEPNRVTAILVRARLLLQRGWCQDASAQCVSWLFPCIGGKLPMIGNPPTTLPPTENAVPIWRTCSEYDAEAARWCAGGALARAAEDLGLNSLVRQADLCLKAVIAGKVTTEYIFSISDWNDTLGRTHQQVLKTFDAAIRRK